MSDPWWLPHPKPVEADPRWRHNAACANTPTHIFFPDHDDQRALHAAEQICAACPVIAACAEYATANRPHGIWAGRLWITRNGTRLRGPTIRTASL